MFKHLSCVFFILISLLIYNQVLAQVSDDFSDGDFTTNPAWSASATSDWTIENNVLRSNNAAANSSFYLSTRNTLLRATQWEMNIRLAFNPSSANYVDVFLAAGAADPGAASTTGYFVRLGNTDDEISLYRKGAGSSVTKIIDGVNGLLNKSNNAVRLKVICTAGSEWSLFRDTTGTGLNYISEGSVTDATYSSSAFFALLVKQSTASFFQKHYFDNLNISAYAPDVTPPVIQSVQALSSTSLDILFNEPVSQQSAGQAANYMVSNGAGQPLSATPDAGNTALVHLLFATPFPNGTINTVTASNIDDVAGNTAGTLTATFSFYIPQAFDIVIDEIMADPTPVVGLPDAEFIEVKNVSGKAINLQGWKIAAGALVSGSFPSYILPPDSFLILTGTGSAVMLSPYGRTLGVTSFPSLANAGALLSLSSKEGTTIHSVNYSDTWYKNAVKINGGWSLEMIDTHNPCTGISNWQSSTDARGGTPGSKNASDGNNSDAFAPGLVRAAATDSATIILTFTEPVQIMDAQLAANYTVSDGMIVANAVAMAPAYDRVRLTLSTALVTNKVYTITASNIKDCSGNTIQAAKTSRVGLATPADTFDVVINEILFNPKPGANDFLEIYNRSSKIINLKDLYLTSRSTTTDLLGTLRQLSADDILLFPGDFYVLSDAGSIVKRHYTTKNPENFIDLPMPSFPDDEGIAVILDTRGDIVDELHYSSKWHFALIDNEEGISLERVDYSKPTQNAHNWHSAASTVGFATPAYQNSQYRADISVQGEFVTSPKTFSPDNDGVDDYTLVKYQLSEPGYVANITIFDAVGRPVRSLAKNAILASAGSFRWDGLNDKQLKVPVGVYVIYTEIFNLQGTKKSFKTTAIVASRF